MKMFVRTSALVGAAGLVATGLVVTAAPASANHVFVIRVNEVQTDFDDDFSGMPERGDSFEWESNLRQHGKRVGTDTGKCTFLRIIGDDDDPDEAVLRCSARYRFFDRGVVRASGKVRIDWDDLERSRFVAHLPVRSGTGDFDDAGGTVRNQQINDERARLTFRLTGVDH
jgi:hypothetical protein